MNSIREALYDNTWYEHAWKTMSNNIDDKTVNFAHIEVRTDVMNHALSRVKSHIWDKLK